MKLNLPLLALALGAFGIGITEFSPMGMLTLMANDLDVSIPAAGLLITAYAIGVVVGAPIMTLGFNRMPRRDLLMLSMLIYTIGNLISALSDSYTTLLIGRIVTSFNHGAFFGVGAVVATQLVPAGKQAGAVAAVFSGLTIANIGGVPLATYVGEVIGWRTAFMGMTIVGVMTLVAIRLTLPKLEVKEATSVRNELGVLTKGTVLFALLITVISSSAMFTVFSYISPILLEETQVSHAFVTMMLVLYGVGLALGNYLAGKFADRNILGTLIISLVVTILLLVLFAFTMQHVWFVPPIILLWGISSFAVVPPLQALVVNEAKDAPNLASSMNIAAFNLGNASGAALGGGVIYLNWGLPAVALAGAGTSILGLLLVYRFKHQKASTEPV